MIVVDPSVGLKWMQPNEENRNKAQKIYREHADGKEKIVVPELFFLEIANAITTKSAVPFTEIKSVLRFIFKSNLSVYKEESQDIIRSCKLAKEYNTSVYDMIYAVIAKKHKTILVTADERFIQKTKFPFVMLLSEYSS